MFFINLSERALSGAYQPKAVRDCKRHAFCFYFESGFEGEVEGVRGLK